MPSKTKGEKPGFRNAILWVNSNPGMYEMLGTVTDEEIAEKFDCKLNRVKRYRRLLGIKFKRGRRGVEETGDLNGLSQTSEPMSNIEVSRAAIAIGSNSKVFLTERYESKYPGIFEIIGFNPDQFVGDKYGISRESVRQIRNKFGMQSSQERTSCVAEADDILIRIDRRTANNLLELSSFISDNMALILRAANKEEGEE
jgi:hypothetical protein